MISWWWSLPRAEPSTTKSLLGSKKVRTTLLSSSVFEMTASADTIFPILFSVLSYSAIASAVSFFYAAMLSSISLDFAISSSHLSAPLLSFFFWETILEISFFCLSKPSSVYLAAKVSYVWLTSSGNSVDLNDFVNERDISKALSLGLSYKFRITP